MEEKQEKGVMTMRNSVRRREYEGNYSGGFLAMEFGRERVGGGGGRKEERASSIWILGCCFLVFVLGREVLWQRVLAACFGS